MEFNFGLGVIYLEMEYEKTYWNVSFTPKESLF